MKFTIFSILSLALLASASPLPAAEPIAEPAAEALEARDPNAQYYGGYYSEPSEPYDPPTYDPPTYDPPTYDPTSYSPPSYDPTGYTDPSGCIADFAACGTLGPQCCSGSCELVGVNWGYCAGSGGYA